jgi:hypothetical protein
LLSGSTAVVHRVGEVQAQRAAGQLEEEALRRAEAAAPDWWLGLHGSIVTHKQLLTG